MKKTCCVHTKTFDLTQSDLILSHLEAGSQKRKMQWTIMRFCSSLQMLELRFRSNRF
jgi:hypothetical protein